MKILDVCALNIPEIKVIRFARFIDHRGYFSEQFRRSDLKAIIDFKDVEFVQANESFSKKGTLRGLHFQWNPFMGKLVRTLSGHMIDLVLDIRVGSPTFGEMIAYDMPSDRTNKYDEWIWIPPGFAHGNFFLEDSCIEYLCSGEYSQGNESGISPLSNDIKFSLCDHTLKRKFASFIEAKDLLITDKDRNASTVQRWKSDARSNNFMDLL